MISNIVSSENSTFFEIVDVWTNAELMRKLYLGAVIPEPTITLVDLAKQPSHKGVILLAVSVTDGMFDYVSLEEIAQALSVPYLTTNSYLAREASPLELAAEDLIRTASDRWIMNNTLSPYRDDITIAVRRVR